MCVVALEACDFVVLGIPLFRQTADVPCWCQLVCAGACVAQTRCGLGTWHLQDEEFKDPEVRKSIRCKVFLAFTSNLISAGTRETIRFLVQHKCALPTGSELWRRVLLWDLVIPFEPISQSAPVQSCTASSAALTSGTISMPLSHGPPRPSQTGLRGWPHHVAACHHEGRRTPLQTRGQATRPPPPIQHPTHPPHATQSTGWCSKTPGQLAPCFSLPLPLPLPLSREVGSALKLHAHASRFSIDGSRFPSHLPAYGMCTPPLEPLKSPSPYNPPLPPGENCHFPEALGAENFFS